MTNNKTNNAAAAAKTTNNVSESKKNDMKKVEVVKKEPERNFKMTPPDIEEVNKNIRNCSDLIETQLSFGSLPSLFDEILRLKQYELKDFLYSVLRGYGYSVEYADGYLFAKGDIPVMLCAHMDTVHKKPVSTIWMSDSDCVWSPQGIGGDDRCGIYTILMNITSKYKPYILFTENEEIGCIGAGYFVDDIESGRINKDDININFIIEIDRKGANDSVFYDCDNYEFEEYINEFGFKTAFGTCSDISYVAPALGVAAVNLSCGYYNQHTLDEFIVLDELYDTINKVRNIVKNVAEEGTAKFEYIEAIHKYRNKAYDDFYSYYRRKSLVNGVGSEETEIEEDYDSWFDDYDSNIIDVTPVPLNGDAYIIDKTGQFIDDDHGVSFYIDEDGRLYHEVNWDDTYVVVKRFDGTAYSANAMLFRFNDVECITAICLD